MKKYLIFGATGSIGSALANELYEDKKECHLIGRDEVSTKKIASKFNYSYSICDVQKLNFADMLILLPNPKNTPADFASKS